MENQERCADIKGLGFYSECEDCLFRSEFWNDSYHHCEVQRIQEILNTQETQDRILGEIAITGWNKAVII